MNLWNYDKDPIEEFVGKYYFLSNFSPYSVCIPVESDYLEFKTAEHAYQSFKTKDISKVSEIMISETPEEAKNLGRNCTLRKDWEEIKDAVMYAVLMNKFSDGNKGLKSDLIRTYPAYLQEGNNWGDKYWGVVKESCAWVEDVWTGENKLGFLLMLVRYHRIMENLLTKHD